METFSMGYALLSVQRALLDVIVPELRAVVVDVCKETESLYLRFYYDGEASEKLIDLWQCATTEASADFGPDTILDDGEERLDYPQEIPARGRLAYLRKEPYIKEKQSVSAPPVFTDREFVDFKEIIGLFVSPVTGETVSTTWGVIHHATDGRHIIPGKPEGYKITDIFPVSYTQLAIQKALLGNATPELRAIIVDVPKEEKQAFIRIYYDGQISENLINLWECVISKTWADLGSDYELDAGVQRLDYPQKIPHRGRYAYSRREQ